MHCFVFYFCLTEFFLFSRVISCVSDVCLKGFLDCLQAILFHPLAVYFPRANFTYQHLHRSSSTSVTVPLRYFLYVLSCSDSFIHHTCVVYAYGLIHLRSHRIGFVCVRAFIHSSICTLCTVFVSLYHLQIV